MPPAFAKKSSPREFFRDLASVRAARHPVNSQPALHAVLAEKIHSTACCAGASATSQPHRAARRSTPLAVFQLIQRFVRTIRNVANIHVARASRKSRSSRGLPLQRIPPSPRVPDVRCAGLDGKIHSAARRQAHRAQFMGVGLRGPQAIQDFG